MQQHAPAQVSTSKNAFASRNGLSLQELWDITTTRRRPLADYEHSTGKRPASAPVERLGIPAVSEGIQTTSHKANGRPSSAPLAPNQIGEPNGRPSLAPLDPNQIGGGRPGQGRLTKASVAVARRRSIRDEIDPSYACHWDTDVDSTIVGEEDKSGRRRKTDVQRLAEDNGAPGGPRPQAVKSRARKNNPFIEYENREKRLQQERKWLQEDPKYMQHRTSDLKHGKVQQKLYCRSKSAEMMGEDRVLYGDYAVKMRQRKERTERLQRNTSTYPTREMSVGKSTSHSRTLKGLQRTLTRSVARLGMRAGPGRSFEARATLQRCGVQR